MMLTTSPTVFKRGSKRLRRFVIMKEFGLSNDDKKHTLSVVAECPVGRSGTLQTTREGKPPAESGAVSRTLRVLMGYRGALRLVNAVSTPNANSQKQETPTSTGESRGGPSAVGRGSALHAAV